MRLLPVCSLAAMMCPISWSFVAHGAEPTVDDCLRASDASLKLDSEHKLRAERTQLLICAAASCPKAIRNECVQRVDDVNRSIPNIVFEAKDNTGHDVTAVKVQMDGELLAESLNGTALSVDPGEHQFVFEMAGQAPVEMRFVIRESQKDRHEVITFKSLEAREVTSDTSHTATDTVPPAPASATTTQHGSKLGTQRIAALVAGGVGVVGVALGSVFGFEAMSKKSDAKNACPNATCPTQGGSNLWRDAKSAGTVSTIAFIAGGASLAGAAALWFTANPKSQESPQLGFSPSGVQLKGRW